MATLNKQDIDALRELAAQIRRGCQQLINRASYDRTSIGQVTAVNGGGLYTVAAFGGTYTLPYKQGFGSASTYATMTYVGQQISAAGHISKSIVETLPAVKDAKDNVIYMIKKATPDGSNLYDEYMLISGALEKIGDTKTVIETITNTQIDTILAS